MKNLIDSCKTKVKHASTSCQRRLYGFQRNTACSLYHSIRNLILYSLLFKKKYLVTTSSCYGKRGRKSMNLNHFLNLLPTSGYSANKNGEF
jgi:hypothetical protein